MKKFKSQLAAFLIFPTVICIFILSHSLERKYAWNSLPTDCDCRGSWIYNRLYQDTSRVDIAFLGTSHTLNGIEDTTLSRLLSEKNHSLLNVVNFAYCRFGNELAYVIAKDLFAKKKPKLVVIEINEKFGTASHPVYPYYADTKELILPSSFLQQAYPANLYNGFLARLTQTRKNIFDIPDSLLPNQPYYGYRGYPFPIEDTTKLIGPDNKEIHPMGAWRKFTVGYPQAWITDLVKLCQTNSAEILFLYIPAYHDHPTPVEGMDFYTSLGKVLLPPADLLRQKNCWRDKDHLNDKGADALAHWLSNVIDLKK